jgi:hypothetical protein
MSPVAVRRTNSELVAVAFLKLLPFIDAGQVATDLPKDQSKWAELGFVTVTVVGGTPNVDLPQHAPVVTVDVWANSKDSVSPPWPKAVSLATDISAAFQAERVDSTPFDTRQNFGRARVLDAVPQTEPRRIENDPQGFARVAFDLLLHWVEVP